MPLIYHSQISTKYLHECGVVTIYENEMFDFFSLKFGWSVEKKIETVFL